MDGNASGAGAGIVRRWALVLIGSIFSGKFLPSLRADPSLGSGPAVNDDALPLVSERKGIVTAGPVSRILSCLAAGTVIPLRRTSLYGCSDLPGTFTHCWVPYRAGAPSRHAPEFLTPQNAQKRRVPGPPFSRIRPLFGLAPCGVCHARAITGRHFQGSAQALRPREWRRAERLAPFAHPAVRSYRTFSPLPLPCGKGGIVSVALSVDWP